ncbi:MAG: C4-type zinc ribbon domain-containing protein [Elusimicrobiota bacterium]|jgi:hypothetical protein
MAFAKENIRQLITLQENDSVLDKLLQGMGRIPIEIAALRQGAAAAKAKLEEVKARALTWEKKKKEKELELASKEEAARKHSLELNQVKTNEAFKALQQEIEQAKRAGGAIETEILEAMEGIDAARKEEKVAAAEFKTVESRIAGEVAALEKELADLQAKLDAQKAGREQAAAGIPADMMRVYEHARMRGKLDAIVPIESGNCSACRISLAPQVVIEVTKAKALVVCESCQRILYKPETAAKAA